MNKKLLAIMRVKNEIGIIRESLSRLSELADEIIVLDNGSNDGTLEAYQEFPKVAEILRTEGFNEGRDKIMLLEAAKARRPDWLIFLDADEIFEKNFSRQDVDKYMASRYDRINFRFCHFWLDRKHYRVGRKYFLYSLQPLRCMWRHSDKAYFKDLPIHNDIIQGLGGRAYFSPYRIEHFGFIDRQKILSKIALYKSIDGDKRDYGHLDPDKRVLTLPFVEFTNKQLNYLFILAYKYACHFLWLWPILYFRFIKLFPKK